MTVPIVRVLLTLTILMPWASLALAQATPSHPPTGASPTVAASDPGGSEPVLVEPTIWLRGPFGRVAGGTPQDPATAAPQGLPLDTFVRRAPLVLEAEDPALLSRVEVLARAVDSPGDADVLSHDGPGFEGPSTVGRHLVVASLDDDPGWQRAWLLDVPDRDPPEDGIYDIPAPAILVSTTAGTQRGILGDGCYIYLCVETGRPTPADQLEPLSAVVGETPELRIGDASALVAWEGSLAPLDTTRGEARQAFGAVTDTATSTVSLSGLEPAGPGEWLLDVEVELDRERGWLRTSYRLVVE